mgnify:CR=1 FL=1
MRANFCLKVFECRPSLSRCTQDALISCPCRYLLGDLIEKTVKREVVSINNETGLCIFNASVNNSFSIKAKPEDTLTDFGIPLPLSATEISL